MLRALVGLGLVAYPFLIYFSLGNVSPLIVVAGLGVLFVLRVILLQAKLSPAQIGLAVFSIGAFCLFAYLDTELRVLKMYPVLINTGAALFCLYTLAHPPSAIERLSVAMHMTVEGPAISYTRNLTMVWVGFFIVSGSIACYTALATSTSTWALYNGLISYVLIGLLLGVEYPIRLRYQKRHQALEQ